MWKWWINGEERTFLENRPGSMMSNVKTYFEVIHIWFWDPAVGLAKSVPFSQFVIMWSLNK